MRIIWTASRSLTEADRSQVAADLHDVIHRHVRFADVSVPILIHGDAAGGDQLGKEVAKNWGWQTEAHPAKYFTSPRARNQHMVDQGADVCASRATGWASGTGMCARMARRAGIETVDYGVDTSLEGRP